MPPLWSCNQNFNVVGFRPIRNDCHTDSEVLGNFLYRHTSLENRIVASHQYVVRGGFHRLNFVCIGNSREPGKTASH
jgi:hypothetical protein